MSRVGVYAGTFDPITNGHIDIVERALSIFDKVVLAIAKNRQKDTMFSVEERMLFAKEVFKDNQNVDIVVFDSLLIDFMKKEKIHTLIRGIRINSDFDDECKFWYANKSFHRDLEAVYFMPNIENIATSSTIVRELIKYKGDISSMVPGGVIKLIEGSGKI